LPWLVGCEVVFAVGSAAAAGEMREPVCLGGERGPLWPHPFARHDLAFGPNGPVQPASVSGASAAARFPVGNYIPA
jgi:hypothetical protein